MVWVDFEGQQSTSFHPGADFLDYRRGREHRLRPTRPIHMDQRVVHRSGNPFTRLPIPGQGLVEPVASGNSRPAAQLNGS